MNHHRRSAHVWQVFSRDFTVLPAHPHVHPQSEWAIPAFAFPAERPVWHFSPKTVCQLHQKHLQHLHLQPCIPVLWARTGQTDGCTAAVRNTAPSRRRIEHIVGLTDTDCNPNLTSVLKTNPKCGGYWWLYIRGGCSVICPAPNRRGH